jgi:hypothetical protein
MHRSATAVWVAAELADERAVALTGFVAEVYQGHNYLPRKVDLLGMGPGVAFLIFEIIFSSLQ